MNKVTTTSTCGRCGATEVRLGSYGDEPPTGWARLVLGGYLFKDDLCPPCQDAVMAVLKPGNAICPCGQSECPCSIAGKCLPGCFYGHQVEAPDD